MSKVNRGGKSDPIATFEEGPREHREATEGKKRP